MKINLSGVLAVLFGTSVIGWHASQYGRWLVDDAAITFAYARGFARGEGAAVTANAEQVEGFSNPTWTALLAIGRLTGLFDHGTWFGVPDYVLFPKVLALLCCAGILIACYLAAREITQYPALATAAVGAALAAIPSFVIWCFSGLENSLYALIVTWLAVVLFRAVLGDRLLTTKVAVSAGVLAAMAALTRPDGLIYVGAYPVVALIFLRKSAIKKSIRQVLFSVGAFVLLFGAYVLWRYLTFHQLLAGPAIAKRQSLPSIGDLARIGDVMAYAGALSCLLLVAVVVIALTHDRNRWAGLVALLVPLGLGLTAYAVMVPDWMGHHRFATPVWVLITLVGVLAALAAIQVLRPKGRAVLAAAMVVAVLSSGSIFYSFVSTFRETPTLSMCYVADRYGRVFNNYADILKLPEASLLAPDLGGTAMTSRLAIVDMAGLANYPIAEFINEENLNGLRDYVFNDVKPTFIVSHGPWGPGNRISSDSRLERDYYGIFTFTGLGNTPAGEWVRKDTVPDPETLNSVRQYAVSAISEVDRLNATEPLRSCGTSLRPGQTTIGS